MQYDMFHFSFSFFIYFLLLFVKSFCHRDREASWACFTVAKMLKGLLEVDTDGTELTKLCQAFQHRDGRYSPTQVKKKIRAKVSNPQTCYLIQKAAEVKRIQAAIAGKTKQAGNRQSKVTKQKGHGLVLVNSVHFMDLGRS